MLKIRFLFALLWLHHISSERRVLELVFTVKERIAVECYVSVVNALKINQLIN